MTSKCRILRQAKQQSSIKIAAKMVKLQRWKFWFMGFEESCEIHHHQYLDDSRLEKGRVVVWSKRELFKFSW